jgi:hypothetical protein
MAKAPQVHSKHPLAAQNAAVSFDDLLEAAEELTGTPTVTSSPSGLTIDNVKVSLAALTINGATVAEARAVQFRVSDGLAGTSYQITVSCGTTSSPAQTLVAECGLNVVDA